MAPRSPPLRAAQYVRMSSDGQEFSTTNQKEGIRIYAEAHGLTVVATYEDAGKSGLTLSGRPALRQLIGDVVAGQDRFDIILVYDVSRWGRFQDADESAHLEYLCRYAGIGVEYCAEPFTNDGTPFAAICKVMKRALAAEYSRELSEKVYIGKRRLGTLGFRQGGSAGFGLRRQLVGQSGCLKGPLAPGEYKNITTDRVILGPGPPEEVAIVRQIYRDYVEGGQSRSAIAAALNLQGVLTEHGRTWTQATVTRVLTFEKYVGDHVWGKTSGKLTKERTPAPPKNWVRVPNAFKGIVSRSMFEQARETQARRAKARRITNDQVIVGLKRIYRKHGVLSARLIEHHGPIGPTAIRKRFGSLLQAYNLAGYRPSHLVNCGPRESGTEQIRAARITQIVEATRDHGFTVERLQGGNRFLINREIKASILVAWPSPSQRGKLHWRLKATDVDDLTIAILMHGSRSALEHSTFLLPTNLLAGRASLDVLNPLNIDVFRTASARKILELCERISVVAPHPSRPSPTLCAALKSRADRPALKLRRPCGRSMTAKSYTGAFLMNSVALRETITRANTAAISIDRLQRQLAPLVGDQGFLDVLTKHSIAGVPKGALPASAESLRTERDQFLADLRSKALDLLSAADTDWRIMYYLGKLTSARRFEAAEIMVIVNDSREHLVRALVIATPRDGLYQQPRPNTHQPSDDELLEMIAEGAGLYAEAKRALAPFARNAWDLMAVEAFTRRLLATGRVVAWLQEHHPLVLRALKRASK